MILSSTRPKGAWRCSTVAVPDLFRFHSILNGVVCTALKFECVRIYKAAERLGALLRVLSPSEKILA